jgi:hypothetical protein
MDFDDHDGVFVEAMFRDDHNVNTVLKVVPHTARRTLVPHAARYGALWPCRQAIYCQ